MSRITFTDEDGQLRWFDDDAARAVIGEGRNWNGNNWVGACSGLLTARAYLYLTAGGRWVEHQDRTREFNGPDQWRFLSDDKAREWLMLSADARQDSDDAEKALAEHFPEIPEESGPNFGGRPTVGPKVEVRLDPDTLAKVDTRAAEEGVKRAEMLRRLIVSAL